jgi:hypothetical protein
MNDHLKELLERAKKVDMTPDQLEDQRLNVAAANGNVTDSRITVKTVEAARTIMLAATAQDGKAE